MMHESFNHADYAVLGGDSAKSEDGVNLLNQSHSVPLVT